MAVILNVDFDADARLVTNRLLEGAGFTVHHAGTVSEAVELTTRYGPDVVVIRLPRVESFELFRHLKQRDIEFAPAAVLRIPAEDWASSSRVGRGATADAILPEHAEDAMLLETVRSMVRLSIALREARAASRQADSLEGEVARSHEAMEKLIRRVRHDVEAPLRAMSTFVEMVAASRSTHLSEDQQTYLGYVLAAVDRARLVLDDLVVFVQSAKQDPKSWRPLHLKGAVAAALQKLDPLIKDASASVRIEEPLPRIRGGFASLQRVIQILVSNAIQYRRADSGVHISIAAQRLSEEEWVVSVADDGIGIEAHHHESIFAPLQRLHGHEIEGSGMGLAICRRVVEGRDVGGIDAGIGLDVLLYAACCFGGYGAIRGRLEAGPRQQLIDHFSQRQKLVIRDGLEEVSIGAEACHFFAIRRRIRRGQDHHGNSLITCGFTDILQQIRAGLKGQIQVQQQHDRARDGWVGVQLCQVVEAGFAVLPHH